MPKSVSGRWRAGDVIRRISSGSWVPEKPLEVEYIVVAGGGSGGTGNPGNFGGGGGAGGYRSSVRAPGELTGGGSSIVESVYIAQVGATYPVIVGTGGAAIVGLTGANGNAGNPSTFASIVSIGGGFGGGAALTSGGPGGSGGGEGGSATGNGGFGSVGQGFPGANYVIGGAGAAGGGAGGTGSGPDGSIGGIGITSSITGAPVTRAAGGRGAGTLTNGTTNSGNGGSGGVDPVRTTSGSGGPGIIILRYPGNYTIQQSSGVTSATTPSGAFKVTEITATSSATETIRFV